MERRQGFIVGAGVGLAVTIAFVLGTWLAPHAAAQTSSAGPRWEYQTIHHGWDDGRWAAQVGPQGWRFVGFDASDGHTLIFERQIR